MRCCSREFKNVSALVCAVVVSTLVAQRSADAHGIPTHQNITTAAVVRLKAQVPAHRLACEDVLNPNLQIGTMLEDEGPRPTFHFTPKLTASLSSCPSVAQPGDKSWGFLQPGDRCSSIARPLGIQNTHAWAKAVAQARNDRKGWKELGYVLHLLEDLTSPAHTRNDPHVIWDPIEGSPNHPRVRYPTLPAGPLVSFGTPEEFLLSVQAWTQQNFFSSDTVFDPAFALPDGTFGNLEPAFTDHDYFYNAAGQRIAAKGIAYWLSGTSDATRDRRKVTIDDRIADEQWIMLHAGGVVRRVVHLVLR